jgi:hypothetical protein
VSADALEGGVMLFEAEPATVSTEPRADQTPTRPIMLIGFQRQGNLGLGYLAASSANRPTSSPPPRSSAHSSSGFR